MAIKVIIVDDHPLVRQGVASMLSSGEGVDVVAQYSSSGQLMAGLRQQQADVVLLDLQLAEGSSESVLPQLKASFASVRILVLSSNDNVHNIKMVLSKGADGYLLKNTGQEFLATAIKEVMVADGVRKVLSPEVEALLRKLGDRDRALLSRADQLTAREKDILQLIGQELTSQEIGERLHLSHRTVESYRLVLMQKLDVRNMVGMVKKAIMLGLIKD